MLWVVAALSTALAGCGEHLQILALNYQTMTLQNPADAEALIDDIEEGRTTIAAVMRSPCNLTVDFSVRNPPRISIRVEPPVRYNVIRINGGGIHNLTTTNNPACPAMPAVILISSQFPDRGALTRNIAEAESQARFFLEGNREFSVPAYSEMRLSTFENSRAAGTFRYVRRETVGSPQLLLVEGSFDLKQQ